MPVRASNVKARPKGTFSRSPLCEHIGVLQQEAATMVACDALDVVVVPFPFTEQPVTKRRPAVVLSASRFNTHHSARVWP